MELKIIQSYVYYHSGDLHECFLVSTINRFNSYDGLSQYAETIVWQVDVNTKERFNKILFQDEDSFNSTDKHFFICKELSQGHIL